MRITTAEIKALLLERVEDGEVHSVSDFKSYIMQKTDKDFSPGQLSGSLYQLSEGRLIENVGRGLYRKGNHKIEQEKEQTEIKIVEKNQAKFCGEIKQCFEEMEQKLEVIVNKINVLELTSSEFEFLGEIKRFNEQLKNLKNKC